MQSYIAALSQSSPSSAHPGTPVSAFFRDKHFRLCLTYFDARRGVKEGHEYEKVLAFYPTSAALTIRTGIVGLAQALASFSSSFAPESGDGNSRPAKFMEAEQKKWALLECEPDIWLVLVVNKAWAGPGCSSESMRASLEALHSMFTLLHGPLPQLLDQDPSGFFIRRVLQPFLDEAGSKLRAADMKDPVTLLNPLGMQNGLPLLSTPRQIFLGVQCLTNQLLLVTAAGSRPVRGAMACWKGHLLWGSMPLADCQALTLLACRALGPSSSTFMKGGKKGKAGFQDPALSASETLLSPHQWSAVCSSATRPAAGNVASSSGSLQYLPSPQQPSSTPSSGALQQQLPAPSISAGAPTKAKAAPLTGSGFLVPKLRQPSLPVDSAIQDLSPLLRQKQPAVQTAHVWLQALQERCVLLPYFDGPLLVLLLLRDDVVPTLDVVTSISEVLSRECPPLGPLLARAIPRKNHWHHPGYRYCLRDDSLSSIRATPGNKVSTLSQQSLRMLAHTSNKLEYWASGLQSGSGRMDSAADSSTAAAGPAAVQEREQGGAAEPLAPRASSTAKHNEISAAGGSLQDPIRSGSSSSSSLGNIMVACRGFGDSSSWVVARKEGGRQLLVAMESVPDASLAGVAQHAQLLCDAAAPGFFL